MPKIPLDIAELITIWREIAANSTGAKQARFNRLANALDGMDYSLKPPKTIAVRDIGQQSYEDIQEPFKRAPRRRKVTEA